MKPTTRFYLLLRSGVLSPLSMFSGSRAQDGIDPKTVKKVLVVTDFRLGDAVLSIPALNAFKKGFPESGLTVFCNRYSAQVFGMVDCVDNLVIYENRKSHAINRKMLRAAAAQAGRFDVAIDLVQDYPLATALWTLFSGAKHRVGYDWYGRGIFFTVKIPGMRTVTHAVDEMLGVCRRIGIAPDNDVPRLSAPEEALSYADAELNNAGIREGERIVAIHPGGFYETQCWIPERFAEVGKMAIDRLKARVIVLGTDHERERIKIISKKINGACLTFLNLDVSKLAAVIARSGCLVCNNSGAVHLAAAVGTPTVSTMGPTVAERWRPKGEGHIVIRKDLPCIGCNSGTCRIGTHQCMSDISSEEVYMNVEKLLVSNRRQ